MLVLNKVGINFLDNCLLGNLFHNFSYISKDSILAFDMIILIRKIHHSKTIYIHFKYIDYFFDIVSGYNQACFKILETAKFKHMMIIYYSSFINYFDYFINHNKNLSFEND